MEGLMMGRGSEFVARDALDLVKVPEPTDTFVPVSHFDLANRVIEISGNILKDYALTSETYGLARQGNQLFAILSFKGESSDVALSVAYRNSLDKSIAIGIATGASVFICSNLALSGEIVAMRRHSRLVWNDLETMIISTLYKSIYRYKEIKADIDKLKSRPMTDDQAFQAMGLMFGRNIISPRQLTTVKQEWLHPSHEEFTDRNAFAYYMACTEALKSSPPPIALEKHVKCHNQLLALTA